MVEGHAAGGRGREGVFAGEGAEEEAGAVVEGGAGGGDGGGERVFGLEHDLDVAVELVEALGGEADAEVVGGDLFELVGLVEDDGGGFGEDAGVGGLAACCLMERSAKKRWWLTMMMSDSSALRRMEVMKQFSQSGQVWPRQASVRASSFDQRGEFSGRELISARSPVSVVFSHWEMWWNWSISSRPFRSGLPRRA